MTFKVIARDTVTGEKQQIDVSQIGGANVVLLNVPCASSVYVGAAVRMNVGGTAINAIADNLENSNIIGIVELKQSLNVCNIRVLGVSENLFSGLDVTKEYYLSDSVAGQITTTIPTASGSVVLRVGQPFSETDFLVNKGQRMQRI